MLKQIVIVAVVLALAAAAVDDPCNQGDDCARDECCVSRFQMLGRRQSKGAGTCQKLAKEKQPCMTRLVDTLVAGGKPSEVVQSPPCAEGFSCLASQSSPMIMPIGRQGVCVRNPTTRVAGSSCNTGVDCADDECCVSRFQPIGKRAIFPIDLEYTTGYCQKMRGTDEGCYVNQANGKPLGMVNSCPCNKGLTCNPGERPMFVMPFGQVGTCQ